MNHITVIDRMGLALSAMRDPSNGNRTEVFHVDPGLINPVY